MDYSDLASRLQGYSENDSLSTAVIEYLIDHAESKIFRDVDFAHARKYQTTSLVSGDAFVTLPTDCLVIKYLQIITGTTRSILLQKDPSFINEYWPDRTVTGTPLFYSRITDGQVEISPTPGSGFSVEMNFTFRPEQMSSSNLTTWLGTNAPNLLFTSCMIELLKYQKGESTQIENASDKPSFWDVEYSKELRRVKTEQEQRLRADGYRPGEMPN